MLPDAIVRATAARCSRCARLLLLPVLMGWYAGQTVYIHINESEILETERETGRRSEGYVQTAIGRMGERVTNEREAVQRARDWTRRTPHPN